MKLKALFESEPNEYVRDKVRQIWKELGPFKLDEYIANNKIDFDVEGVGIGRLYGSICFYEGGFDGSNF